MKNLSISKMVYILALTFIIVVTLSQSSISIYWDQTYHRPIPNEQYLNQKINHHIAKARIIQKELNQKTSLMMKSLNQFNNSMMDKTNILFFFNTDKLHNNRTTRSSSELDKHSLHELLDKKHLFNQKTTNNAAASDVSNSLKKETLSAEMIDLKLKDYQNPNIILRKYDTVFYAGDSLMQGVAPKAKNSLEKRAKIKAIDLSKQGSGLSYPNVLNWPETIEQTLSDNFRVKVLVIFLGPNDPWAFHLPGEQDYLKFKSPEWEQAYVERIDQILTITRDNYVKVIWLGAPCMRNEKLNREMIYLNHLYKTETEKFNQTYVPTSKLLGCPSVGYSDFIERNGEQIVLRYTDGIHFSVAGQRLLANKIISNLTLVRD